MKTVVKVEGMSCGHCVSAVTEALNKIEGVQNVEVSLENKNALVEHNDNVDTKIFVEAIEEQGFDASL